MKYDFLYSIGDSFCFGIDQYDDVYREVKKEHIYSQLIADHFNLDLVNLGSPGCGNESIFNTIYQTLPKYINDKLNPLVIVAYTCHSRVELFDNQSGCVKTIFDDKESLVYKEYILNHHNEDYNIQCSISYINAIRTLFKLHNVNYVEAVSVGNIGFYIDLDIPTPMSYMSEPDHYFYLDDKKTIRGHPKIEGHAVIANKIIEMYQKKYETT